MSEKSNAQDFQPFIPASTSLSEITIKAVILGVLLSVILGAANAYLGLFAGMTVSASIPAAVISMAVLSLFKKSNILENNIVQTAASAGESLAAGVIFTVPALLLIGAWTEFNYWETTLIAGFGGLLGVMFTIPLRRALIVDNPLKFPEGVATAEVLKVGDVGGAGVKVVATAGAIGALFKFGETGLRLWDGAVETATAVGKTVAYAGSNLSPALVGVGYIVGLNIAVLIFLGGAINWYIFIPILTAMQGGIPAGESAVDLANTMWSTQTRYLGMKIVSAPPVATGNEALALGLVAALLFNTSTSGVPFGPVAVERTVIRQTPIASSPTPSPTPSPTATASPTPTETPVPPPTPTPTPSRPTPTPTPIPLYVE
ncbi:oligopeptide transporter, OPT family, partial [candidate division KSB1 bacterium]|nr:oligopeptide transporter, OPT family [candidate division KSB1 bacterium]